MKTFKLWLEPDRDIPRFKRLAFEQVDVPIADVLRRGIHPWQGADKHPSLKEKFVEVLNGDDVKSAELDQMGYCHEVDYARHTYSSYGAHYPEKSNNSPFEETLERVRTSVFFVDGLTYGELLRISKERLRTTWSSRIAHTLLSRTHPGFDEMRTFLKSKDKSIKISSYADIGEINLAAVLSLVDFENEETILISEGIPVCNFRTEGFLGKVSGEGGLLRMVDGIREFQVSAAANGDFYGRMVLYNCKRKGDVIRFIPEIDTDLKKRTHAQRYAERWRTDSGRYCFTTDIVRLSEMIEQKGCDISFPSLSYKGKSEGRTSHAKTEESRAPIYAVGNFLKSNASGDAIKSLLRAHAISMTGRKEELVEKFAKLAADTYLEERAGLDSYFGHNHFIRVASGPSRNSDGFPLLKGHDLRNMLLSMYIIKHLRGATILEASHENDTFDLVSLARSLVNGEVSVNGGFMRV